MKCSVYKDIWDKSSKVFIDVETVLSWIKRGKYKEQITEIRVEPDKSERSKLKAKLLSVVFSGTFSSRHDDNIVGYNNLVVIDIDSDKQSVITSAKVLFDSIESCYAYFLSPSGGLKALIKVSSPLKNHKEFAFEQVKDFIEANCSAKVDPSGKNISRVCYISYDPELYFNRGAVPFNVDTTKFVKVVGEHVNTGTICYDATYCFNIAKKWVNKEDRYYQGNRYNFLLKLVFIMNRAGIPASQTLSLICNNYTVTSDMFPALDKMIKNVSKSHASEFGIKPITNMNNKQNTLL